MGTVTWRGDAEAVAQVDTVTVGGTIEATDIFIMTINGKALSVVGGATDADDVRDAIVTAWNASTIPEFAEITAEATAGTGEFTLTADTAGKPFTCAYSTTETGGGAADSQTFSGSTTTANEGPNDWSTARNWSGNAVPVNSDDVYFLNNSVSVLYGLDQNAVTLTSLHFEESYTGEIGLPRLNEDTPGSSYFEYREAYLKISATTINVGRGEGDGSGRLKINVGSVACTCNVFNTGTPLENGIESLLFLGTSSSNAMYVSKGSVGVAVLPGEAANLSGGLICGYTDNQAGDSEVRTGTGVTLATVTQTGGLLITQSNITTLNKKQDSGDCKHLAGTLGTLNGDGGRLYYQSTGTLTTANVGKDCELNFTRDPRGRTVTNCNIGGGGVIRDPNETVTWTNGFVLPAGVGLKDVELDIGEAFTLTKS